MVYLLTIFVLVATGFLLRERCILRDEAQLKTLLKKTQSLIPLNTVVVENHNDYPLIPGVPQKSWKIFSENDSENNYVIITTVTQEENEILAMTIWLDETPVIKITRQNWFIRQCDIYDNKIPLRVKGYEICHGYINRYYDRVKHVGWEVVREKAHLKLVANI